MVLHLVPLDNFVKPAEGKKKRAAGETKKSVGQLALKTKAKHTKYTDTQQVEIHSVVGENDADKHM